MKVSISILNEGTNSKLLQTEWHVSDDKLIENELGKPEPFESYLSTFEERLNDLKQKGQFDKNASLEQYLRACLRQNTFGIIYKHLNEPVDIIFQSDEIAPFEIVFGCQDLDRVIHYTNMNKHWYKRDELSKRVDTAYETLKAAPQAKELLTFYNEQRKLFWIMHSRKISTSNKRS